MRVNLKELVNSLRASDAGPDPVRQQILQDFIDWNQRPENQQLLDSVDREWQASKQASDLLAKYYQVRAGLPDSEKLPGDLKTLKQNVVDGIIKLSAHLNRNDPDVYVNVCKACKDQVDGPQNRHEGTASIHGAWGTRSVLFGFLLPDGRVVYIRVHELDQFGLEEIEVQLFSGQYGALCIETILTYVNMSYNKDGCINRNMLAIAGNCTKVINSVCFMVVNMRTVHGLYNVPAGQPIPVLNANWHDPVVTNMTRQRPWLVTRPWSRFRYEKKEEYRARITGGAPTASASSASSGRTRTRRSSSSTSTNRNVRTRTANANVSESDDTRESNSESSSDTDDSDGGQVVALARANRVAEIEAGIRVTEGEKLYNPLRHKRLYRVLGIVFDSFLLYRTTIETPTRRQLQFDACLNHLDVRLLQRDICKAKTLRELAIVMMDIVNHPYVLIGGIEPFELHEFITGVLRIPLLELCINVNYANISESEYRATFFQHCWEAHEYKMKQRQEGYVTVLRRNGNDAFGPLDIWLEIVSGNNASNTSYGRVITEGSLEYNLAAEIGVCVNNPREYFRVRDARRLSDRQSRQKEEQRERESRMGARSTSAFAELFQYD